jgi:hypothetical protein
MQWGSLRHTKEVNRKCGLEFDKLSNRKLRLKMATLGPTNIPSLSFASRLSMTRTVYFSHPSASSSPPKGRSLAAQRSGFARSKPSTKICTRGLTAWLWHFINPITQTHARSKSSAKIVCIHWHDATGSECILFLLKPESKA